VIPGGRKKKPKRIPRWGLSDAVLNDIPVRKELLRRCVLAGKPQSLDELAASIEDVRPHQLRGHAEELAQLGALKVTERFWPLRPAGHRYEAAEALIHDRWAMVGLGLVPGQALGVPDEETRKQIEAHIQARREDPEFQARLTKIVAETNDMFEVWDRRNEVPLRILRRAWVRVIRVRDDLRFRRRSRQVRREGAARREANENRTPGGKP
jgi:hypothetical protein